MAVILTMFTIWLFNPKIHYENSFYRIMNVVFNERWSNFNKILMKIQTDFVQYESISIKEVNVYSRCYYNEFICFLKQVTMTRLHSQSISGTHSIWYTMVTNFENTVRLVLAPYTGTVDAKKIWNAKWKRTQCKLERKITFGSQESICIHPENECDTFAIKLIG